LSPSPAVNAQTDKASLNGLDLLVAIILHVLVVTIIATLAFWQQQHRIEPLKRIEVAMISAKELAKMQQQARPQPKKIEPPKVEPKPLVKPVPKPEPKLTPVPSPKPEKAKVEDNFDPFAPLASSTDSKKSSPTPRAELADIAGKQLSRQEMDRYIALIQAAVQRHWKVAASTNHTTDPLVEMQLNADGSVASIKVLEGSGSGALDDSLIRAIRAAEPFELPRQQFEFFRVNRIRFHPLK